MNVFTKLILFTGQMLGGVYEASAVLFTDNNEDVGFTLGAIMRLLLGFYGFRMIESRNLSIGYT